MLSAAVALAAMPVLAQDASIDGGEVVTVPDDQASPWDIGGSLLVGDNGTGTLIIENGGVVSSFLGRVGDKAGASGTVTVRGPGAAWNNSNNVVIGRLGTGVLTIEAGGAVSGNIGYVGLDTGSGGTVTVTGENSTWTNSGLFLVGYFGDGALTIAAGGTVSNTSAYIGYGADSLGTVTVGGEDSTWTNSGFLIVGNSGGGALTIENGGRTSNATGYIGYVTGSNGTVTVRGQDATWDNDGDLYAGESGFGTLTIENGGAVSNRGGFIGNQAGSTGMVTVSGIGSAWNNINNLVVGSGGTGSLTIEAGGVVSSSAGYIAASGGSPGTVTVRGGSNWTNSGVLGVGQFGVGTLAIESGGSVSNTAGYIGNFAASDGAVSVDGAGSTWTNSQALYVGNLGAGALVIRDGGAVSNMDSYIGYGIGSQGTVSVAGAGSAWNNSALLHVGFNGAASLDIADGGAVSNTSSIIGYATTSAGAVTVAGAGSTWTNSQDLQVGRAGTGRLTIADGATVGNSYGYIGHSSGSQGTVSVAGAGSTWSNSQDLQVGGAGTGVLDIADGGKVVAASTVLAASGSSSGTLNLDTGGVLVTGQLAEGWGAGGGRVVFDGGILRLADEQLNLFYGFSAGDIVLEAGGGTIDTDGYFVLTNATLEGVGGLTKVGGMLALSGANSYLGTTRVVEGTLAAYAANAFSSASTHDVSSGAILNLTGYDQTIGGLTGSGEVVFGSAVLTVGANNASTTFDGVISDWGSLVKVGTGTLTLTGANTYTGGGTIVREGTLAVNGGSISPSGFASALTIGLHSGDDGTLTIGDGGFVRASETLLADQASSIGVLRLEGGAGGSGVLQIEQLSRGIGDASVVFDGGTLLLAGDQADLFANFSPGTVHIDAGGARIDTQGFEVATGLGLEGVGGLTKLGAGTLALSGTNDYAGATHVDQGILQAGAVNAFSAASTHVVAAGAVLDLDDFDQAVGSLAGAGDVFLGAAMLSVGANDASTTFGGVISGSGGLIKTGTGTLTLAGNNLYTGTTKVLGGLLDVTGTLSSALEISAGGRIGGNGTFGTVVVGNGGILAPGNSIGTLTIGDLTLSQASELHYDLGAPGTLGAPGASDLIIVLGNLVLDGQLHLVDDGGAGIGHYRLMTYGGSLTDNLLDVVTPGPVAGATYTIAAGDNVVDLIVAAGGGGGGGAGPGTGGDSRLQYWRDNAAAWTATGIDWRNSGGTLDVAWAGHHGVFNGTGATIAVEGTQSFQGLQFVTDNYVLAGPGALQTVAGGSELRVLGGETATIATRITGADGIAKTQEGTLILAGANLYAGPTVIEAGTLALQGAGSIASSAALSFTGAGLFDVSGVAAAQTQIGTLSGGAGARIALGNTDLGVGQAGNGAFAGTITGGGGLEKTGDGTLTLSGINTYSGPTRVNAGRLDVAGTLASATTVNAGGTLMGIGMIGGLTLNSGGTLSPGNSIGTLTVSGDATFHAGAVFLVEIEAPNRADLLSVAGTTTINGGVVQVAKLSPETSYQGGQSYRIIESGALVRNADFSFANPFLFATSELRYGANSVDIVLTAGTPDQDFPSAAYSFNQAQAAHGLSGLAQSGDALAVYNEVLSLTDVDQARRVFDLSSGEVHAAGQHVIDQTFALFSRTLRHKALAGVVSVDAGAHGAKAWLAPLGGRGTLDTDDNAATLERWAAGFAGGYEGVIDVAHGTAYAGFGLGYLGSHGAVDARLSHLNGEGAHAGIYGGWSDGPWTLAGALAYAGNSLSSERRIVWGGLERTAKADYWSHAIGFSGEALYDFDLGGGTTLSPLFTLDAGWSGHGGFTETGAGALDLIGAAQSWTRLDAGLGIAFQHVMLTEGGKVTLNGRAVWEHAFADIVPSQNLALAGSPTGFSVHGADAGRDRLGLGAGVSFETGENLTLRASYDGIFSASQKNHTASIGLDVRF